MTKIKQQLFISFAILFFSLTLMLGSAGGAFAASSEDAQATTSNSANFEASLTKEVRHQLVMLPFYSVFDNLQYQVEGSKVTLLGQVTRPDLKSDAENAVKHVEGVEVVSNQLEVLPPSPGDDRIRREEFRAIYSFPSLQMYGLRSVPPIHIIVNTGHVTLEGSVASEADKDTAGIRANAIPDVFSVTNNLRVDNGR
ncbi:MAG TPA: BON domain-containing protein [Candidatus Acidoferrales bacterium]|jgi:hyperosmotically inducible protein|nr:BON domain-containing protein [Candidatus Acidoferrales bacterium]